MGSSIHNGPRTGTRALTIENEAAMAAFFDDWRSCRLNNNEWTHAAHLVIGTWMVCQHENVDAAMDAIRPAIKAYNLSNGQENSDMAGYHESVTRFSLLAIDHLLGRNTPRPAPFDALGLVQASDLAYSKFPFFFYSHAHLMTKEARLGWVEPDLRPLSDFHHLIRVDAGL